MDEEIKKLDAYLRIRDETLQLHFQPCCHDEDELREIQMDKPPGFYEIMYAPATESYVEICKLIDMMFSDVVQRWNFIPIDKRSRFLLMVCKTSTFSGPHDFWKIFCTVHCIAVIIQWRSSNNIFTQLEKELLMYSSLCHGVNAQEHKEGVEVLGGLEPFPDTTVTDYSTSFYYTKLIFKNCKIFSDEAETESMLCKMNKLMRACYHVRVAGKYEKIMILLAKRKFVLRKQSHRQLLRICIMTVAGFAVHLKPFIISVEHELKKRQYFAPVSSNESLKDFHCEQMDLKELAISQRDLLDTVIIPWALVLRTILPYTTPITLKLIEEREKWNEISKGSSKDYWIPMKIEPEANRHDTLISFLEHSSIENKQSKQFSSSESFICNVNPLEMNQSIIENSYEEIDNISNDIYLPN